MGCVDDSPKMVTQWVISQQGELEPNNTALNAQPKNSIDIAPAYFAEGNRLSNGWSGSDVPIVGGILTPTEYVFISQKSGNNYYWFQIK